ncbi:MAG: hypothetical protein EBU90_20075 [Proteobacteria bacterium]|nr:hypothetical protein [Pseudomonadota bacterium]
MTTSESTRIAEGYFNRDNYLDSIYNSLKKNNLNLPPVFQRWVVLETIFDPSIIDENKIAQLQTIHGKILNVQHAIKTTLPRNSILARPIYSSRQGNETDANINLMFLFPMFPSSLSMPCKSGEHVWVMFESLTQRQNLGYWVCSIVGPGHIDDVNHVHSPREFEKTFLATEENVDAGTKHQGKIKKPRYHFKNGIFTEVSDLDKEPGEEEVSFIFPQTYYIQGGEDQYSTIIKESDAGRISVYESVPRFKKRPGDIALEGSNNALIVLGRDRTGNIAEYETINEVLEIAGGEISETISFSQVKNNPSNPQIKKKNAGSIDIVAGRGQRPQTGGKKVINHLQNEELAKDKKSYNEFPDEGNPDFINDRSRIYVSQNTLIDSSLELTGSNESRRPAIKDSPEGDAGIIIKSDKVRIFARSDVQILVTGYQDESVTYQTGEYEIDDIENFDQLISDNKIKTENRDSKKWASITIKSNGDIVFQPSDMGYIKLGGEDANRGIVCTTQPVVTSNGGVAGSPLLTTDGGQMAGSSNPSPTGNIPALPQDKTLDLGTYANKVLIK